MYDVGTILDSEEMDTATERLVGCHRTTPSEEQEEAMVDTHSRTPSVYLTQFHHLVSVMKSLNLLHFFADFAVADILQMKVNPRVFTLWGKQVCALCIGARTY